MYKFYLYKAALLVYGLIQVAVGIIFIIQRERLLVPLSVMGGAFMAV